MIVAYKDDGTLDTTIAGGGIISVSPSSIGLGGTKLMFEHVAVDDGGPVRSGLSAAGRDERGSDGEGRQGPHVAERADAAGGDDVERRGCQHVGQRVDVGALERAVTSDLGDDERGAIGPEAEFGDPLPYRS